MWQNEVDCNGAGCQDHETDEDYLYEDYEEIDPGYADKVYDEMRDRQMEDSMESDEQ